MKFRKNILLTILILDFWGSGYAQWVKTNGPDSVSALISGDIIWGGDVGAKATIAGNNSGVHYYIHNFVNWTKSSLWPGDTNVRALAILNNYTFAGTQDSGVYRTINPSPPQWTGVSSGLTSRRIRALVASDNLLFVGTADRGVSRSSDLGASWISINSGLLDSSIVNLTASGSNLFAGTQSGGLFLSTNSGMSWAPQNTGLPSGKRVSALAANGSYLFAAVAGSGIFRSSNNGSSWLGTGLVDSTVCAFAQSGGNVFVGTQGKGVFLSSDNGLTWTAVNSGLTNHSIFGLTITYENIFAGTGSGVWFRPLAQMSTSLLGYRSKTKEIFELVGWRAISFSLSARSLVSVKVYNTKGDRVAILFSEEMNSGTHHLRLNTAHLPRGLYLFRLQAGGVTETRKVLLSP